MKRSITRTKGTKYCTLDLELSEAGRLSICGSEGTIIPVKKARHEALNYWIGFFEDQPSERVAMNERCGTAYRSARAAAKYVLDTDGELHGLDVEKAVGQNVYVVESCGQIRETVTAFFPEVAPIMKWHLNDMHAGCEHQEELGWGHGRTIALERSSLTPAQDATLHHDLAMVRKAKMDKEVAARWAEIRTSEAAATRWLKRTQDKVTLYDVEQLAGGDPRWNPSARRHKEALVRLVESEIPIERFEAALYKDCIGAPCPECGYKYGTEWLKRDLPTEVVTLVTDIIEGRSAPFDGEVAS